MDEVAVRVRERVLFTPHHAGPIVVLSARNEPRGVWGDETQARRKVADTLNRTQILPYGAHTAAELREVLPMLTTDVTLVTSAYHQTRAFLTFVAVLPRPWALRVWNVPCMFDGPEVEENVKILTYQATGDVASFASAAHYLDWRDACP